MRITIYIKRYLILISLLILFSCEKQIKMADDDFRPSLVLNCLLDTANIVQVQVSKTSFMNDTSSPLLNGAKVELWENGIFKELLTNTGSGLYVSSDKPKIAIPYEIVVSYPGFKTIRAIDTIPEPVPINKGTIIVTATYDVEDPIHEVTINFEDPPDKKNYYEIILKGKQFHVYSPYDTLVPPTDTDLMWFINTYASYSDDPVIIAEGDQDYKPRTSFFSDKLINGKNTSITVKFTDGNVVIFFEMPDKGFEVLAELRSISYAYYQYKKTWWKHLYNQGVDLDIQSTDEFRDFLFTGEPVNLYNNVENGYGILASFSNSYIVLEKINK